MISEKSWNFGMQCLFGYQIFPSFPHSHSVILYKLKKVKADKTDFKFKLLFSFSLGKINDLRVLPTC